MNAGAWAALIRAAAGCAALGAGGPPAIGQGLPAASGFIVAGTPAGTAPESHAWAVIPVAGLPPFAVVHLPPRGGWGGGVVVGDGRIELPVRLERSPELLAAWDATVYLVFAPEPVRPGQRQRRVLTITATRPTYGDAWQFNTDGRLEAAASIPSDGRLLGFAGSPRGPVALLDDQRWGGLTLLVLADGAWRTLAMPGATGEGPPPAPAPPPVLVPAPDGPALLIRDRESPGLWRATFSTPVEQGEVAAGEPELTPGGPPAPDTRASTTWRWQAMPIGPGGAPFPDSAVSWSRGRLVYVARTAEGQAEVWSVSPESAVRVARLPGVPTSSAVVTLDQSDRLIVLGVERGGDGQGRPAGSREDLFEYRYNIREVSLNTGRVLFSGPPSASPPLSASQFRVLVLLLLGIVLVILLFVLRPAESSLGGPLVLPPRTSLAEPGRRLVAALLDLAPAVVLASRLTGIPVLEAASVEGMLGRGDAFVLLVDSLAAAFVHTTVCESLFGRSLGKALTGCEVVRVIVERSGEGGEIVVRAARPRLWQAAIRSLVKWGLAPLAFGGVWSPDRRHAGDRITRTVVIVRSDEDGAPPG